MQWLMLLLFLIGRISMIEANCTQTNKFYTDCGGTRAAAAANLFCLTHQMTLINLTNGSATLTSDITLLNITFAAKNCSGNFWYSSGSHTGLPASTAGLGDLLGSLTNTLNAVLCIVPFLCPASATPAPILNAFTICTRPVQQRVVQKCSTSVQRSDMQQFRFTGQSMQAGILSTFPARSAMVCSGLCSSDEECVGTQYNDGTCTLYM